MAEQRDDQGPASKLGQAKKGSASSGPTETPAAHATPQDTSATVGQTSVTGQTSVAGQTSATVVRRKQRYLIGFRALPGIGPLRSDPFLDRLAQMEGVEIIRRLSGRGTPAFDGVPAAAWTQGEARGDARGANDTAAAASSDSEILVARMDELRGESLRQNAPPHIVFELDAPLGYSYIPVPELMSWQLAARAMPYPRARREIRVRVLGEGDRPLANAVVNLYASSFPAQAITDISGNATLQTDILEGPGAIALYVRPAADHWERYLQNPSLEFGQTNVIRLSPLERMAGRFPGERPYGWGQRLMKFDRASADLTGAGTKIGLIDSGCDSSHPQLRHIARGLDLTRAGDAQSWKSDELGHGTHCAGTIAAAAIASPAMIGCAPASEVHIFKVVPGGYSSDLIDALDQCIERRLDVVQIGVNTEQFSELVAQKITEARLRGIACIVPAGNSGGPVQFPGNVPGVMTVSAVGKLGEYPQDTRHAQRALPQFIPSSGVYATNFSGWGPQVGLCAPGVAVISTAPGGGYAAWDGSSMAAAHVVGMSALLLSHHPMLQSINYGARAEQRVSVLFDLLRAAAIPYAQVDPNRVGAGVPDLQQLGGLTQSQPFPSAAFYGSGAAVLQAPMGASAAYASAAYLADSMNALLRLRAAGLWV
ncbi:MAG TPA: S8 family serine peptidase [Steroidobacteraceae bacterium]|nr:S8 family serine peptidase [Steroidobacteraceae bacterium]